MWWQGLENTGKINYKNINKNNKNKIKKNKTQNKLRLHNIVKINTINSSIKGWRPQGG
jgi:hypothetical protein